MAVMLLSGVHSILCSGAHAGLCPGSLPTDPQQLPRGGGSRLLAKEGTEDAHNKLKVLLTLESIPGSKQNKHKVSKSLLVKEKPPPAAPEKTWQLQQHTDFPARFFTLLKHVY